MGVCGPEMVIRLGGDGNWRFIAVDCLMDGWVVLVRGEDPGGK